MKISLEIVYSEDKENFQPDGQLLFSASLEELIEELTYMGAGPDQLVFPLNYGADSSLKGWFIPVPGQAFKAVPCVHRGGGIYITDNCSLSPQVSADELGSLTQYDYNVMAPGLGLNSFDKADGVKPADLLDFNIEKGRWKTPEEGINSPVNLEGIDLLMPPSVQEIIEQMQNGVGTKDPKEIPGDPQKKGTLDGLADKMGLSGAKGENVVSQAGKLISGSFFKAMLWMTSKAPEGSSEPTWIDRLEKWASQKLDNLMKERQKALDKLLDMLKDNPDKGLEYALPIDGDDAPRGIAPPSSSLSRRNPVFSLKGGGSGPTDYWDVGDDYYWKLQQEYRRLAKEETKKGNHQKAAYIYASLLGDYSSAAKTLREGKHYHEAAVIYKEKLKRPLDAAECFEEGGILDKAAEIYIEQNKHEKAGDLCVRMEKFDKADEYYRIAIDRHFANGNFLEAAEIFENKVKSTEEALEMLDKAWPEKPEARAAKMKKISLLQKHERHEDTIQEVERLMAGRENGINLLTLEILTHTANSYENEIVREKAAEASLVVTSECLENLDLPSRSNAVNMLMNINREDRLFKRDCNRILSHIKLLKTHQRFDARDQEKGCRLKSTVQLEKNVHWQKVITVGHEFLLAGVAKGKMLVTRINDSMQTSTVQWNRTADGLYGHLIFELDESTGRLILALYGQKPFDLKAFPTAGEFVPLKVGTPGYLTRDTITIARRDHGWIFSLRYVNNQFVINESNNGQLTGTEFINIGSFMNVKKILSNDNELFFVSQNEVCIKPIEGSMEHIKFNETVYDIVLSPPRTRKRIFVSVTKGAVIVWPDEGKNRIHIGKMLDTPEIFVLRSGIICLINRESGKGWLYRTKGDREVVCLDRFKIEPDFLQLQQGFRPDELAVLYESRVLVYKINV